MDTNLNSFNGPEANGSYIIMGEQVLMGYLLGSRGPDYSSTLKFSTGLTNFQGTFFEVFGGTDAVVDVNNLCNGVSIWVDLAHPQGQFFATVKGGSRDIFIQCNKIERGAHVCELMLDDWSDQSHEPTANVKVNLTMLDGSPVRVIALKAKPIEQPGSGPYSYPWWTILNIRIPGTKIWLIGSSFEVLRRWGLFRSKAN